MKSYLLCLLLVLPAVINAQLTPRPAGTAGPVGFYEFLPEGYDPDGAYKYPLIIAMHGTGERGNGTTELESVLQWGLGEMVSRQNATLKFNFGGQQQAFMVLFPQLSLDYVDWQVFYIDAMIDYAISNLNVDVNKIFLQGYSLGGGGAWLYPSSSLENANRIAGIIPTAPSPGYLTDKPGYENNDLCNIAQGNVAVWAHHSVDDDAIDVQFTIDAINGINDCSPVIPPLAHIYPDGMHNQTWLRALDTQNIYQYPNMWEWMAGTTRANNLSNNQAPAAQAGNNITLAIPLNSTVLDGSASRDPNDVIVKYAWTKISGPTNFTIEKADYPVTNLSNLELGDYIFRLTVTDQFGVVRSDDVQVTVTTALPVGLSSFKGKNSGSTNSLSWVTLFEENADYFEILRSNDGNTFSVIGKNTAGRTTYSFNDNKAPAGISYYRLRNVSKDGSFTYSEIIKITNNSPLISLQKYPNPVRDKLTLVVEGAVYGTLEISIYDILGKQVKKQTIIKSDIIWKGSVDVGFLQKGIYNIQIQKAGSLKESSSFVKE